jgi:N-methylhydantoinase A
MRTQVTQISDAGSNGQALAQIAVDIGGTFTDGVAWLEDGEQIYVAKALTTPTDPGVAVSEVVGALIAQLEATTPSQEKVRVRRVIHGTTLVTNTLVERQGARVALIISEGTQDSLDIRRELRYDTYDLDAQYPVALIPAEARYPLTARLGPNGETWRPLEAAQLDAITSAIGEGGYAAVAVCLLHSPANDAHEQAVGSSVRKALPDVPLSLSSEIAREIGEYERMSTVAANAYVQPIVSAYLRELTARLETLDVSAALHVMLSNGAFTTADIAAAAPIRILESGPAGGVLSAVNCAAVESVNQVLAFDMGGTTAKACVAVDGRPTITHVFEFARVQRFKRGSGLPAVSPSIDLIEIGAGGGSLASVSDLGLLQVGPQSAGAEPGPACYGLGGSQVTVTDADLVLGYLDANNFLGGRMTLSETSARAALAQLGKQLGLESIETAWGIHDVVNENMAAAARTHIAEQGLDARRFTMVATGGAGPVHAVDVARRLRIPTVLCPVASGVGSCLGFLAAPARSDRSWSRVELLDAVDLKHFEAERNAAFNAIVTDLATCGVGQQDVNWQFSAEVRYVGQGNTVQVALDGWDGHTSYDAPTLRTKFEFEYERLYRKTVPGGVPEIVTWRISGRSRDRTQRFSLGNVSSGAEAAPTDQRRLYRTDTRAFETVPVYRRSELAPGTRLRGPLVVTEPESTLVVAQSSEVSVLASGTVQVNLEVIQ